MCVLRLAANVGGLLQASNWIPGCRGWLAARSAWLLLVVAECVVALLLECTVIIA